MSQGVNTEAVRRSAVLVTFGGGYYNWKRRDRKAEQEYARSKGIQVAAYETKKNLFAGCDSLLAQIKGLVTEARAFHYDHTMPWPGAAGIVMNRIVPKYTEGITKYQNRMEELLEALEVEWDTMRQSARKVLGPAFDSSDYPSISEVKEACYIRAKFDPVPKPSDFDELQQVEERLKTEIKDQAQRDATDAFNHAVLTGWERLRGSIKSAKDNLGKDADAGQRFRTEWHGNLSRLLSILEGLNISGDPQLTAIGEECKDLLKYSPDALKQSQVKRDETLEVAERISSKLDGIFASFGGGAK
jgi:hypothetical protein